MVSFDSALRLLSNVEIYSLKKRTKSDNTEVTKKLWIKKGYIG